LTIKNLGDQIYSNFETAENVIVISGSK